MKNYKWTNYFWQIKTNFTLFAETKRQQCEWCFTYL